MQSISISKTIKKQNYSKNIQEERFDNWKTEIQTDPSVFYGKNIPTSRWAKKLGQIRIKTSMTTFKRFPKQSLAFEFANSSNLSYGLEQYFVFAHERGEGGKRDYIVTTLEGFWEKYLTEFESNRWFYEVIPENQACHLYFDLEYLFQYKENAKKSKEKIISYFESFLCYSIEKILNVSCNPENILRLDATSEKKFSQHWIIKLKNKMFANNFECGSFVKLILNDLERENLSPIPLQIDGKNVMVSREEISDLCKIIIDENGNKNWFVDINVYTRNRNFRLYGSQKKSGISPPLYVANSCKYPFVKSQSKNQLDFQVFLCSLITYRGSLYKCISSDTGENLLHCKSELQSTNSTPLVTSKQKSVICYNSQNLNSFSSVDFPFQEKYVKELDKFILQWLNLIASNNFAFIRKRCFSAIIKQIRYEIGGSRFCQNVKREHKSNHIFIIVDLINNCAYQKCLDPDCKSFISEPKNIPVNIMIPLVYDGSQEDEFDKLIINELDNGKDWP